MLAHDGVNQSDNNNEISSGAVNYPTGIARISNARALESAPRRNQQQNLRKCKSDCFRRRSKIDRMGSDISRSRSLDNIETEGVAYASLKKGKKDDFDDSDDDYKLLESTDNDSTSETDDNCATTSAIEQISTADDDALESTRNSASKVSASHVNCTQHVITPAGNEVEPKSDFLCEKYSTLPRVKFKKGNVDHEMFARCSMPHKSFDYRACSKASVNGVDADNESAATTVWEVLEKRDKENDFSSLRCTTLPKTRSRLSEPYSRRSLRRAIDSTMPRKHFSYGSEHSAVIIPASSEAACGTGKKCEGSWKA